MADNVNVKPSIDSTAISVATDEVSNVHYPVYKLALGGDGEAELAGPNNELSVRSTPIEELLSDILYELKLNNAHLALMTDEVDPPRETYD